MRTDPVLAPSKFSANVAWVGKATAITLDSIVDYSVREVHLSVGCKFIRQEYLTASRSLEVKRSRMRVDKVATITLQSPANHRRVKIDLALCFKSAPMKTDLVLAASRLSAVPRGLIKWPPSQVNVPLIVDTEAIPDLLRRNL